MSQSPTPIRRGADARDTQAFAKQIAASLLTQNDAPQPVSPVPETKKPLIEMHGIRKSYYIGRPNELEILHGIDLTVYPGEFGHRGRVRLRQIHPDEHHRRAG